VAALATSGALQTRSILVHEWNGRLRRVTALEEDFAWEGKTYPSLSTVARATTGGQGTDRGSSVSLDLSRARVRGSSPLNGSRYPASTKTEESSNESAGPRFDVRSRHFKSLIRSFCTSARNGRTRRRYSERIKLQLYEQFGWWAGQDSNLQPDRYERPALTIELPARRGRPLRVKRKTRAVAMRSRNQRRSRPPPSAATESSARTVEPGRYFPRVSSARMVKMS
jgi:hypothetical protein